MMLQIHNIKEQRHCCHVFLTVFLINTVDIRGWYTL